MQHSPDPEGSLWPAPAFSISHPVRITVPGSPPRNAQRKGPLMKTGKGWFRKLHPGTQSWMKAVAWYATQASREQGWQGLPGGCAALIMLELFFPLPTQARGSGRNAGKPKKWASGWHTAKPDYDNVSKPFIDALTAAGLWADDAQVAACLIIKRTTIANVGWTTAVVGRLAETEVDAAWL